VIVLQHRAFYTSAAEDEVELAMRAALAPIFERYGVDLVLCGHKHNYERLVVNGVTFVVSGGGGGRLTAFTTPEPGSEKAVLAHHFVLVVVDGDRLSGTAIDSSGQVIDSWELAAREEK
jgi:3',5'-cyclic AMP phosphodiesterase CpdA